MTTPLYLALLTLVSFSAAADVTKLRNEIYENYMRPDNIEGQVQTGNAGLDAMIGPKIAKSKAGMERGHRALLRTFNEKQLSSIHSILKSPMWSKLTDTKAKSKITRPDPKAAQYVRSFFQSRKVRFPMANFSNRLTNALKVSFSSMLGGGTTSGGAGGMVAQMMKSMKQALRKQEDLMLTQVKDRFDVRLSAGGKTVEQDLSSALQLPHFKRFFEGFQEVAFSEMIKALNFSS